MCFEKQLNYSSKKALRAFLDNHPHKAGKDGTRTYVNTITAETIGCGITEELLDRLFADEDFKEDADHLAWMYGWRCGFDNEIERKGRELALCRRESKDDLLEDGDALQQDPEMAKLSREANAVAEFDRACDDIADLVIDTVAEWKRRKAC